MKIALLGYGKMGKAIEKLALAQKHEVVLRINSKNTNDLTIDNLKQADIAIEFSTPHTAADHIKLCLKAQIPVVIGTTAWSMYQKEIEAQCKEMNGAMLVASNFSLGVNIFFELNRKLAQLMNAYTPPYRTEINEIHHTAKLDSPSGTAISLANDILACNSLYQSWENFKSDNNIALPIISHRIPDVPGTHSIKYFSEADEIEIKHTAYNREGFASGALLAAQWIIGKKGIFSMKDVLSL